MEVERTDGSSGDVSVRFEVSTNSAALGGRAAVRGIDWVDPNTGSDAVVFKSGETK